MTVRDYISQKPLHMLNAGTMNIGTVIFFFLSALASFVLFYFTHDLPGPTILLLCASALFVIVSFLNVMWGLSFLALAIVLSPELPVNLGGIAFPLRFDDILIIVLFVVYLARLAVGKASLKGNRLYVPMVLYLVAGSISVIKGFMFDQNINTVWAFFVLLKRIEYYVIFFLVVNLVQTKEQVKKLIPLWLVAALAVSFYGIAEHIVTLGQNIRLYTLGYYEGQGNHMGGFLMMIMLIILGLVIHTKTNRRKTILYCCLMTMFYPFLFTLSRESFVSFACGLALLGVWKKIRLVPFVIVLLFVVMWLSPVAERLEHRLFSIPENIRRYEHIGYSSFGLHLQLIKRAWNIFVEHPFFGVGFGSMPLGSLDSQLAVVPAETGLLGTIAFLWLNISIAKSLIRTYKMVDPSDKMLKGFSMGMIAAYIGILVQSLMSIAFVITLIIAPFWYFMAMIITLETANQKEVKDLSWVYR